MEKKQQITIHFESHRPNSIRKSTIAAVRLAREMNLNIPAGGAGHYKKTNQLAITVISSPHVHKKSRDQYKIDRYCAFLQVFLQPQRCLTEVGRLLRPLRSKRRSGPEISSAGAPEGPKTASLGPSSRNARQDRDKFLEFKNDLYRLHLDEGFSLTFTYLKREEVAL